MARPKSELPAADAIRARADEKRRLAVRVTPGAREEAVVIEANRISIKVRAKPEDGAANAAVLALLARALGVPRSAVTLLRGATSREKLVQLGD